MMVSIIIPVFNGSKYLKDCLQSIKNQIIKNIDIEIIIVDDNSTDCNLSTFFIDLNKEFKFKYFKCLKNKENRGPAFSRNRGVMEADGDYIAFLDVDDMWEPTKLEKQFNLITDEVGLVYTARKAIYEDGSEKIVNCMEKVNFYDILKNNHITCSSVLVKKEIILKHLMDETMTRGEDYYTWLNILKDYTYALGINEPLVLYRVHKGSLSSNKFNQLLSRYNVLEKIGLSFPKRVYYLGAYALSGFSKYYLGKKGGNDESN